MASYGGIVDSYATYVPIDDKATGPATPSFDLIPTEGTEWCGVDEVTEDGPVWCPSVCTSESEIEAASEGQAVNALLDRNVFSWPEEIAGWRLRSVRHEVVLDETD